ncbi:hypothetical protein [Paenibacillus hexagrammi]|uniref:Uncharacterized protein n=1 Tax=Paenibacillus hexagrammi TaxID=2908839 RepID=A0ABY3SLY8_9BACL|nr:hypothetical protein [Paenibacillus sp. YPD9-1]UJF35077.1 hypothetical protein L0M14_08030 [Paenibacillus sp. YPD9-1]
MQSWISFLFGHWYVVIIVITLFYQLRNKRAATGDRKQSTPAGMPSFGGGGKASALGRQPVQAQPKKDLTRTIDRAQDWRNSVHDEDRNRMPRAEEQSKQTIPSSQTVSPYGAIPAVSAAQSTQADDSNYVSRDNLTANQLAQGLIWAEILGPPRARKPYRK